MERKWNPGFLKPWITLRFIQATLLNSSETVVGFGYRISIFT
jgi:hypothetical protein